MVEIALRQRTERPTSVLGPDGRRTAGRGSGDDPESASRPSHSSPRAPVKGTRWWRRLEATAMAVALAVALGVAADAHRDGLTTEAPIAGVRLGGLAVGGLEGPALEAVVMAAVQAALDRPLLLRAGEVEVETSARTLGAVGDPVRARAAVLALGKSGDPVRDLQARIVAAQRGLDVAVGARFDERKALAELLALAPALDRPSLPTRLDLERRRVEPAVLGTALLAHDALSAVAVGLASGSATIDLPVSHKPPVQGDALAAVGELDVSVVLGSFDTPYSMEPKEADRNFNLKVGATKVSGAVLLPGETFSFNDRVGARDAENGFRYGGGITGGELVDVLGGGICQVSSTLYGAAFFAGLEVVEHRQHSRPSTYVDMGLDATVVWPDIDLKVRNPFDFPVVLHMSVHAGKARAEVLGARRPWQVAFERDLVEVISYRTIFRDDDSLRSGVQVTSQRGMRGFKVTRKRKFLQAGELLREEPETLSYPPTTEIVRRGTNPNGATPEPKVLAPLRDPSAHLRIVQ